MLFQVGKGAVLILTESEWADVKGRDVVIQAKAVVIVVPDDSTAAERIDAYERIREIDDA